MVDHSGKPRECRFDLPALGQPAYSLILGAGKLVVWCSVREPAPNPILLCPSCGQVMQRLPKTLPSLSSVGVRTVALSSRRLAMVHGMLGSACRVAEKRPIRSVIRLFFGLSNDRSGVRTWTTCQSPPPWYQLVSISPTTCSSPRRVTCLESQTRVQCIALSQAQPGKAFDRQGVARG